MPIKILKKIPFVVLFYFILGISNAEENLKKLGKFKDWESFILVQGESKVCYAQSIPVVRAPKKLKRDSSRLFVSFRPSEKIKNEVSVTNGRISQNLIAICVRFKLKFFAKFQYSSIAFSEFSVLYLAQES